MGGKQIVVFERAGALHACNNRCPHEGYPLSEGTFDDGCVLTCNWHNWKFDVSTGANLLGGDALRTYPVRVDGDSIELDVTDPPAAVRQANAEQRLAEAFADHDYDRLARETARFLKAGGRPEVVIVSALERTATRFELGMTHAHASAEAWLRVHEELEADDERVVCLVEAQGYLAWDTLREADHPFHDERRPYDSARFLTACDAQDETTAVALVNDALASPGGFAAIEGDLAAAALAHYQDFGHSLIYVLHVRRLVERLGDAVALPLVRNLVRSIVNASREDLIPEFRGYGEALAAWPRHGGSAATSAPTETGDSSSPDGGGLAHLGVGACLSAVGAAAAAGASVSELHRRLLAAGAHQFLHFDAATQDRTDNPVDDNVGWLDVTHEITFASAVREQCKRFPALWPAGLLQMACFVGRNARYLDPTVDPAAWRVTDPAVFERACLDRLLDPGLDRYIFSVHLLKTFLAAREECRLASAADAATLRAALNRFFHSPIKPRHVLRTARQALRFVALED
jgi:nitrite reductase/ring-hydroxylating ferredoxin subunit